MHKHWDIFCKVVDNFGDIGVCWRLAKQLHHEHGLQVRLFVDNLAVAKQILIGIDANLAIQKCDGVTIVYWHDNTAYEDVADIVIETFACGLPPTYLENMHLETIWINLDYLSAEPWISDFHAKNGKFDQTNLTRHFYFPGFNESTGGLLREQDLITRRDHFQQSTHAQQAFLQSLGITNLTDDLKISLFSYANAPLEKLLDSLVQGGNQTTLFLPLNDCLPSNLSLIGGESLAVGNCVKVGNLTVHVLPFLTQDDYDKLLWLCDVNFVRGEESWARALWAGKPFIWQPYLQTDNTHLIKLNAFLETFYTHHDINQTIVALYQAWSVGEFSNEVWAAYLTDMPEIKAHTLQQSNALIQQAALVPKLAAFCANLTI